MGIDGKHLIFSAPSGSGKTTIVHHLLKLDLNLKFSISATSRKARSNETEGLDYYFLSQSEFINKINNNEFLEWEEVYPGQFYGTLISEVENSQRAGQHLIFDIDVVGGLSLKKIFGEYALAVFIKAPSIEIMEERLRKRGTDSEEQLVKRIAKAKKELEYADKYDYILINKNLDLALKEAEKIVREFL